MKISALLKYAADLSLPVKLTIGATLGALGGTGFLTFAAEYATYAYAIFFEFRPPVEGVPYLTPLVTVIGILGMLSMTIALYFTFFILSYVVWWFDRILSLLPSLRRLPMAPWKGGESKGLDVVQYLRQLPFWASILFALAMAVGGALIFGRMAATFEYYGFEAPQPDPGPVFGAIYMFLGSLALLNRNNLWLLALVSTITAAAIGFVLAFSPVRYAEFLRWVSYGGGTHIRVSFVDKEDSAGCSSAGCYLLLRTKSSLVVLDNSGVNTVEIPISRTTSLTQCAKSGCEEEHRLPGGH